MSLNHKSKPAEEDQPEEFSNENKKYQKRRPFYGERQNKKK